MPLPNEAQLPLAVGLKDEATFVNFLASPENLQLVNRLREPDRIDSTVLIWGPPACGRTHLLQACCHQAGGGAFYLPLGLREQMQPEILEGVGGLSTICIDDVHFAAGDADWERALVRLINAANPGDTRLLLSAPATAGNIPWRLADLRSRLQQALVFRLHPLGEAGIREAFALRARNRGLRLTDSVIDYICIRAERRLDVLMDILQRLDESEIRRQHRISIPQAKRALGW